MASSQKTFGSRYAVSKLLGKGAFGVVYLVEDAHYPKGNNLRALKVIHIEEFDAEETQGAVKEARLMAKLNHPYVVKFIDSFLDRESICIVTEYCDGGDLADYIKELKVNGELMDESRAARWFVQMVLAVSYMHSKKMLHRDLKTGNIYLKNDSIKIGDFGISRLMNSTMDMAQTWIGTPYYMSPEALLHRGYNSKSDIWSLGIILYEICALKRAFVGSTLTQVTRKIVEGKCPTLPEQFSRGLQEILESMLNKEASERPSANELLKTSYLERQMEFLAKRVTLSYGGDAAKASDQAEKIRKIWNEDPHGSRAQQPKEPENHTGQANQTDEGGDAEAELTLSPRELMILKRKVQSDARADELRAAARQSSSNNEIARIRKEKTLLSSADVSFFLRYAKRDHVKIFQLSSNPAKPAYRINEERSSSPVLQTLRTVIATAPAEDFPLNNSNQTYIIPKAGIGVDDDALGPPKSTEMKINTENGKHDTNPTPSYYHEVYTENVDEDNNPCKPPPSTAMHDSKFAEIMHRDVLNEAQMADSYYSQYEGEFSDETASDQEEAVDGFDDDDEDGDDGPPTVQPENSADALLNCMKSALTLAKAEISPNTLTDDQQVFSPEMKMRKIENLRKTCIEKLGGERFAKAYVYVYGQRMGDSAQRTDLDEFEFLKGLQDICPDANTAFLLDQLVFLEHSP